MPNAADYQADGYITYGELARRVSVEVGVHEATVRQLLPGRLSRVRAAMAYVEDVVQPDDYRVRYLYWEGLVDYCVTLWQLTDFGRVAMVDAVELYRLWKKMEMPKFKELKQLVIRKQVEQSRRAGRILRLVS
jgi:hypothetical protein